MCVGVWSQQRNSSRVVGATKEPTSIDTQEEENPAIMSDAAAAAAAAADGLVEGAHVELHGLKAAADMNGKRGVLLGFNAETGRWSVKVDGTGPKERMTVKPANIKAVPAEHKAPSDGVPPPKPPSNPPPDVPPPKPPSKPPPDAPAPKPPSTPPPDAPAPAKGDVPDRKSVV